MEQAKSKNISQTEITTGAHWFYTPELRNHFLTFPVRFQKPIDRKALFETVDELVRRFPYMFLVPALSDDGSRYVLVPSEENFTPVNEPGIIELNSPEARGFLVALGFFEDTCTFSISHGITDGMGSVQFIKTFIYAYLCRTTGKELSPLPKMLFMPDEEPDAADSHPVFPNLSAPKEPVSFTMPSKCFAFSEDMLKDEIDVISLELDFDRFRGFAREHGGNVSGLMALLCARAILRLYPDITDLMAFNIPADVRDFVNCPRTLRNCTVNYKYIVDPNAGSQDVSVQLKKLKDMLVFQNRPECQVPGFIKYRDRIRHVNETMSLMEKQEFFAKNLGHSLPAVSWLGKFEAGECEEELEDIGFNYPLHDNSALSVKAIAIKNKLNFYVESRINADFKDALEDELEEKGLL